MANQTPEEGGSHEAPYTPPTGPESGRVATLEAEVAALEEQLDQREQQLDDVVARYETLLEERTRAASEAETFVWTGADEGGSTDARSNADDAGLLATVRSLF